jgi:hypothetical protein
VRQPEIRAGRGRVEVAGLLQVFRYGKAVQRSAWTRFIEKTTTSPRRIGRRKTDSLQD